MNHALPVLRRTARWMGPAVALLLSAALVLAGTHHHSDLRTHDVCVLCTSANAPAVATSLAPSVAAPAAAPLKFEAVCLTPHSRLAPLRHPARAPPAA